ncbi:MAG: hypothetical protein WB661_10865 [Candidatus Bathyarchaeia archaeon]
MRAEQTGSDFLEELLPLLRRFTATWEQNVVLGDHRWQSQNMKAMQRFAKGLSTELLELDSQYSGVWAAYVRGRMHQLSAELREFVTPDMRDLSAQDHEVIIAHGKAAYELTAGLISYLEPGKPTRKRSDEQ